jgi:hypothetical protein
VGWPLSLPLNIKLTLNELDKDERSSLFKLSVGDKFLKSFLTFRCFKTFVGLLEPKLGLRLAAPAQIFKKLFLDVI